MTGDRDLLAKAVWTDADFEAMGWHDSTLYAVGFCGDREDTELVLDLDYVVNWIDPIEQEDFTFAVAPATLVFRNVSDLKIQVAAERLPIEIESLERRETTNVQGDTSTLWVIEGDNGFLRFFASGFSQYFRARPMNVGARQRLTQNEREGLSFERPNNF